MSTESSLFIRLAQGPGTPLEALRSLVRHGWRLDDHGRARYLPLGDDGSYDWRDRPAAEEKAVWGELERKAAAQETLGVVLTFEGTQVGGEFLFFPDRSLSVSLSVNLKLKVPGVTDVGWYLERLAPALTAQGGVEEWSWKQLG